MDNQPKYIVKKLEERHRDKILAHFLRLDKQSRYERFCSHRNDHSINEYISKINFTKDGIFGVFNDEFDIIGLGECVIDLNSNFAEVAFCVERNHQNQGLGGRLMEKIVYFARSMGKDHLEMVCLKSNQKSRHLALKFGLKIKESLDGESVAVIDMDKELDNTIHHHPHAIY